MHVIILRNDNASGTLQLSSNAVDVKEDTKQGYLNIVRKAGSFGEVVNVVFYYI